MASVSQPFYQRKTKYSGMDLIHLKKLRELEAEVSRYKKIVAEQTLHLYVIKEVIEKKL